MMMFLAMSCCEIVVSGRGKSDGGTIFIRIMIVIIIIISNY